MPKAINSGIGRLTAMRCRQPLWRASCGRRLCIFWDRPCERWCLRSLFRNIPWGWQSWSRHQEIVKSSKWKMLWHMSSELIGVLMVPLMNSPHGHLFWPTSMLSMVMPNRMWMVRGQRFLLMSRPSVAILAFQSWYSTMHLLKLVLGRLIWVVKATLASVRVYVETQFSRLSSKFIVSNQRPTDRWELELYYCKW